MKREELLYYLIWLLAAVVFIGVNIYASTARARPYCFPADPDHIPYMIGTNGTYTYRALCPRTPTVQKPYCPTP